MIVVPGAVGLRRKLLHGDPADPVQHELELVCQDGPQLVPRALWHAVQVQAAGREVEVAGVGCVQERPHGLLRRVKVRAVLAGGLLLGREPIKKLGHARDRLSVEPPRAVLAPGEDDLPIGVTTQDERVGLPGIGDRHQVDVEPAKNRLELRSQSQPDAGAILGASAPKSRHARRTSD